MLIQTCTQENKEALFDEMSSDVGQLLAVDTMDTLSEFCEIFDGTSKQVVSDDESELLMIYKTEVLDAPDDDKIMFTYSIPMDVCFPSYNKPSYVIKHVVDTLFSENLSQDYIVALLPHLPFLGQSLLIAGFSVIDNDIVEDVVNRDGTPIDCYAYVIERS